MARVAHFNLQVKFLHEVFYVLKHQLNRQRAPLSFLFADDVHIQSGEGHFDFDLSGFRVEGLLLLLKLLVVHEFHLV